MDKPIREPINAEPMNPQWHIDVKSFSEGIVAMAFIVPVSACTQHYW